jgi:hypothetical protein
MPECQLLAQTYDSITFQYSEKLDETKIIKRALELIKVELKRPSGWPYVVPGEAKVGWNWGEQTTQAMIDEAIKEKKKPPRLNLDGLVKWSPGKPDQRTRTKTLDRRML